MCTAMHINMAMHMRMVVTFTPTFSAVVLEAGKMAETMGLAATSRTAVSHTCQAASYTHSMRTY